MIPYPKLGEADPGGLGACPQKKVNRINDILFPEKEAKSVCSASQRMVLYPRLGGVPHVSVNGIVLKRLGEA
jgi:hypothetical protein